MNEDTITNVVQSTINANNQANQFGVSSIPFHTHNGLDSPKIPTENLSPGFTKGVVALTSSTMANIDCSMGNIFTLTLIGNTTFSIAGARIGSVFMVEVTQGSGTTFTNTWWSGITWATSGATAPVQTTTSGGVTTYGFRVLSSTTYLGYLIGSN